MSSILYYSKFCEHSNKLLQTLSKTNVQKDIHFICIDKRIKDSNGKMFISYMFQCKLTHLVYFD